MNKTHQPYAAAAVADTEACALAVATPLACQAGKIDKVNQ